jgi:hypothetical protein
MPYDYISKLQAKRLNIPRHSLHTILINDDINLKVAKNWLKKHNYLNKYPELVGSHYRFEQTNPIIGAKFYSKKIDHDITFVFQAY